MQLHVYDDGNNMACMCIEFMKSCLLFSSDVFDQRSTFSAAQSMLFFILNIHSCNAKFMGPPSCLYKS